MPTAPADVAAGPALAATLDAAADGAFGGKPAGRAPLLGDSSDKAAPANHRAGYSGMLYNGRTYTDRQWAERIARAGGCLAAGEGGLLVDLLDAYRVAFGRLATDTDPAPASGA